MSVKCWESASPSEGLVNLLQTTDSISLQVFYFHQRPFPPQEGIFRKRISWAGDVMGRDASIVLQQVKFTYNGTFVCQVKNPPDVHGAVGLIHLRVVTTGQQRGTISNTAHTPGLGSGPDCEFCDKPGQ